MTKYRRAVYTDEMLTFAENTVHAVCSGHHAKLVELNDQTDHLHLLMKRPPSVAISTMAPLKGCTAYPMRRAFTGALVRARMRPLL